MYNLFLHEPYRKYRVSHSGSWANYFVTCGSNWLSANTVVKIDKDVLPSVLNSWTVWPAICNQCHVFLFSTTRRRYITISGSFGFTKRKQTITSWRSGFRAKRSNTGKFNTRKGATMIVAIVLYNYELFYLNYVSSTKIAIIM